MVYLSFQISKLEVIISNSVVTKTHLTVHSATAAPAPLNSASTSIPSSVITVLSTSKQTAWAYSNLDLASIDVDDAAADSGRTPEWAYC